MSRQTSRSTKQASQASAPNSSRTRAAGSTSAPSGTKITHEAIARLAFHKWQKRGCPTGDDRRDWFEAERELKTQLASSPRGG